MISAGIMRWVECTQVSSINFVQYTEHCLVWVSSSSTVLDLFCCILFHECLGERSGLQAGQSSTRTLLLCSHAVVIDALWGLAWSCWYMKGLSWNKVLDTSICCFKTNKMIKIYLSINQTKNILITCCWRWNIHCRCKFELLPIFISERLCLVPTFLHSSLPSF